MKCEYCRADIKITDNVCSQCGNVISLAYKDAYTAKFTSQYNGNKQQSNPLISIVVIFSLIFFFPVGLLIMWILRPFTRRTRWIISLLFIGAVVFGFGLIIWWTTLPGYLY